MCGGGGGGTDYAGQEAAAKAEANRLKYEKDVEIWKQNKSAQDDKRQQASKDSFDRRAQRSLLSKGGQWGKGIAKSYIGTEAIPDLQSSLLSAATTADGTVIEEDPLTLKKK